MAAFEDIITWAGEKLRPWQQDALRRIVDHDQLSELDLKALAQMCRNERGVRFASDVELVAEPLSAQLAKATSHRPRVILLAISETTNLNKLAGETPLGFGPTGLTIVYGDNGSGKTGYSRILNVLCRARDKATIHRNVFSTSQDEPSAKLSYEVDGQVRDATWTKGADVPPELRNVSVFDVDSASMYVDKDHEVAYAPFGLDLLDRLAKAYLGVQDILKAERLALADARAVWPESFKGTSVAALLEQLPDATAVSSLVTLSAVSPDDQERHREAQHLVTELRRSNPSQTIASLQSLSQRLVNAAQVLETASSSLSDKSVSALRKAKEDAEAGAKAAQVAANALFKNEPLSGVGEDVWRQLWEAARRFSEEHAYVGQEFPVVGDDALCPLCLQTLEPEGRDRFGRFEAHIRQDLEATARKARIALATLEEPLGRLATTPAHLDELVAEVDVHDPGLAERVKTAFGDADKRRSGVVAALKTGGWESITPLGGDAKEIRDLATSLTGQADKLKESLAKGELPKHEAALKEYEARANLGALLPAINREVARLVQVAKLDEAIDKDTDWTPLSKTSTALTKKYVTETLTTRFDEELKALSAGELSVVLEKRRSQHGTTSHQVKLRGAKFPAAVGEIASEGEQSAIALAAFLAEVQQTPADAGIVLDDPVTSMDHLRRDRVATRLVAEAVTRQVIVFTHEIEFLMELVQAAKDKDVPLKAQTVISWAAKAGMPERDLPWIAMNVGKRVGFLRTRHQEAKVRHAKGKTEYESFAKETYGFLREAWERGVEELVLNGVVRRYSKEVKTQQLKRVAQDLRPEDYEVVDAAMTRCSEFFRGHDQPATTGTRVPSVDDLAADIGKLESWVAEMNKRRN